MGLVSIKSQLECINALIYTWPTVSLLIKFWSWYDMLINFLI